MLLFVKIVVLNVAVNSHSNAILTLLVSNNFIELKGAVFKKFEQENLLQVSCSGKCGCVLLLLLLHTIQCLLALSLSLVDHRVPFRWSDAVERFQLVLFLGLILLQDFEGWQTMRSTASTAVRSNPHRTSHTHSPGLTVHTTHQTHTRGAGYHRLSSLAPSSWSTG